MFIKLVMGLLLAPGLLLGSAVAYAQELQLLGDGALIIGVVSNADGSPAADIAVQIAEASQPQATVATLQTDAGGTFIYTGNFSTNYQITAGNTRGSITLPEAPPEPFTWPPIYITLGALMLLSLIPARMLRRKEVS